MRRKTVSPPPWQRKHAEKGNTPKEMARKLDEYFRAGVRLVWYVKAMQCKLINVDVRVGRDDPAPIVSHCAGARSMWPESKVSNSLVFTNRGSPVPALVSLEGLSSLTFLDLQDSAGVGDDGARKDTHRTIESAPGR